MPIALQYRNDPGGRCVATGQHKGHAIEIVSGYYALEDNWIVHVYIDGKKLDLPLQRATGADHAEQKGLEIVIGQLGA